MSKEIFDALHLLEQERAIPLDFMIEKIKKAIITACKNSYDGNEDVTINMDEAIGSFEVQLMKEVVENVELAGKEISLEDAKKISPSASLGDKIAIPLDTKEFGRIAAQTARNIIRQGIKDGERDQITQEFQHKQHEIVSALVERIDPVNGALTIRIGKAESMLPPGERIGIENVKEGDHIRVYISEVKESGKGPHVMISRTSPNFVGKLFEMEVPEIASGEVVIKSISREAGSRTKMAVASSEENVDPIGSCIGNYGARVQNVVDELGGEKIDIIKYSDDPVEFVKEALLPAKILDVEIVSEETKSCIAFVNGEELSLAIGNRGQNVRLAAKLTGWKIDIKPKTGIKN